MNILTCTIIIGFLTLSYEVADGVAYDAKKKCIPKDFGYASFVCVCNSTYCDTLPPIRSPTKGQVIKVTSNSKDKRWVMEETILKATENSLNRLQGESDVLVTVNRSKIFQKILGFGGAFTDATGINLKTLSKALQENLLRGYFAADGLEYSLGRVPIAGTDFSTHPYSYDDLSPGQLDPELKYFALKYEDFTYKIPFIKKALAMSSKRKVELKLFASPWSAPAWMKNNGKIAGDGRLLKKYHSAWAAYFVRFLEQYQKYGINFFAVTTQNEPTAGLLFSNLFNEMAWTPEAQGEWIGNDLGPQLEHSGFENVTIIILDDQRLLLPSWAEKIMDNKKASKYVGMIGVHWYWDFIAPPGLLNLTHSYFPDIPILYTEACAGSAFWDFKKVIPGSWARAEKYAMNILEDLQHWVVGWTDWNMALNLEGGPNWAKNFVDSPILVNQAADEAYRQPMFYALAHFSKAIPRGSQIIEFDVKGTNGQYINLIAFIRPDQSTGAVMINVNRFPLSVEIQDGGQSFKILMDPRSIVSLVWRS